VPRAGIGHPRVRQFLNIKHNRGPNPTGAVALEGLWSLRHAIAAGIPIEVLFVCEALLRGGESNAVIDAAAADGATILSVSERVLHRLVDRDGPDGLAAIARLPRRTLDDIAVRPSTRIVIADHMELAGNVGTIIRCADGAGAAAVLLTERQVRLTHPLVMKASMATLFSLPVIDASRNDALGWIRRHRIRIVAADPAAASSYREANYRGPIALVLGSERYGLAPFWRDAADTVVSIPMLGVADSLNVGHAAALVLYEALHQQRSRTARSGRSFPGTTR